MGGSNTAPKILPLLLPCPTKSNTVKAFIDKKQARFDIGKRDKKSKKFYPFFVNVPVKIGGFNKNYEFRLEPNTGYEGSLKYNASMLRTFLFMYYRVGDYAGELSVDDVK